MALTAQQRIDLEAALRAAYSFATLDQAFTYRLGRRLSEFVAEEGFEQVVFHLLNLTEQQGWTRRLVRIAVDRNPGNSTLLGFLQQYPEFDRTVNREEMADLQIGFTEAFPTYPQFQAFIRKRLDTDIGDFANTDPNSPVWGDDVVPRVINWFDDKDEVDRLIEAALDENPADAVLRAKARPVLQRLRKRGWRIARAINDYDSCVLNGRLFINRQPLRTAVRVLSMNADVRVLAVNGPEGSGKSYSVTYFGHIAEKQKAFEIASVDLNGIPPAKLTPEILTKSIVRQMGRVQSLPYMPAQEEATPNWWVRELCNFIVGEIKAAGRGPLLIVLDGFHHKDLHPDTREMVKELVNKAAAGELLRVALLHFVSDLIPVTASGRVATEELSHFTKEHVSDTLLKIARWYGEEPDTDVLNEIVDGIWSGVAEDDAQHTRKIAEKVGAWAQQIALAAKVDK